MTKILILGGTGMLGNAVFRLLSAHPAQFDVTAAVRSREAGSRLPVDLQRRTIVGFDATDVDSLLHVFAAARPHVVINCVGLVKQNAGSNDPLSALSLNAILPHRLAKLTSAIGARLIHISTDCVFSGRKGNYVETDEPDALDLYGRSKLMGEVVYPHTITLRTSMIGHELGRTQSLVDWFLSQEGSIKGFTKAIFSGLPTVELARVIASVVIPRSGLSGVYHVASAPISKFDLLTLVAKQYGRSIEIVPDDALVIDRSLDGRRFAEATGYRVPSWPELVCAMYQNK